MVNPQEAFFYKQTPGPGLAESYKRYFLDPKRVYLFHSEEYTAFRGTRLSLSRPPRRPIVSLV